MGSNKLDCDIPYEFFKRMAQRTLDGVLIVDEKFHIILANQHIAAYFSSTRVDQELIGKDYFSVMFGLDVTNPGDLKRAEKTPLYKAIRNNDMTFPINERGKGKPISSIYPIVTASGLAYQVETRLTTREDSVYALEFWNRLGDADVFKDNPSYIEI